jgi:hypothetical protein
MITTENNIRAIKFLGRKEEQDLYCESMRAALHIIPYKYANKFIMEFGRVYEEKKHGQHN